MLGLIVVVLVMAPFVLASWFFAWWLFDRGATSRLTPATAIARSRSDRPREDR